MNHECKISYENGNNSYNESNVAIIDDDTSETETIDELRRYNSIGSNDGNTSQSRRVSFPKSDSDLVTGYLEPANPWESASEVSSIDELKKLYETSCRKHNTEPLSVVLEHLKSLDLSKFERQPILNLKNTDLSPQSCEALEEIFKRIQYEAINLSACNLNDVASSALFDMIEYYEAANELDISDNPHITTRGWQSCISMIRRSRALQMLTARGIVLSELNATSLGKSLNQSCLHTIKLEHCGLTGRPLSSLCNSLRKNTTLRELWIAYNDLCDLDAEKISDLLRANAYLEFLDISNNNIKDAGVKRIVIALIEQSTNIEGPNDYENLNQNIINNTKTTTSPTLTSKGSSSSDDDDVSDCGDDGSGSDNCDNEKNDSMKLFCKESSNNDIMYCKPDEQIKQTIQQLPTLETLQEQPLTPSPPPPMLLSQLSVLNNAISNSGNGTGAGRSMLDTLLNMNTQISTTETEEKPTDLIHQQIENQNSLLTSLEIQNANNDENQNRSETKTETENANEIEQNLSNNEILNLTLDCSTSLISSADVTTSSITTTIQDLSSSGISCSSSSIEHNEEEENSTCSSTISGSDSLTPTLPSFNIDSSSFSSSDVDTKHNEDFYKLFKTNENQKINNNLILINKQQEQQQQYELNNISTTPKCNQTAKITTIMPNNDSNSSDLIKNLLDVNDNTACSSSNCSNQTTNNNNDSKIISTLSLSAATQQQTDEGIDTNSYDSAFESSSEGENSIISSESMRKIKLPPPSPHPNHPHCKQRVKYDQKEKDNADQTKKLDVQISQQNFDCNDTKELITNFSNLSKENEENSPEKDTITKDTRTFITPMPPPPPASTPTIISTPLTTSSSLTTNTTTASGTIVIGTHVGEMRNRSFSSDSLSSDNSIDSSPTTTKINEKFTKTDTLTRQQHKLSSMQNDDTLNKIKKPKGLQALILWNNNLTRESAEYFSDLLNTTKSLELLNIGKNILSNEFLRIIKSSLQRNTTLSNFGLQSTHLNSDGIRILAEIIEFGGNNTLQRIDIRDNNVQVDGLTALADALKSNNTVTRIDIDDVPKRIPEDENDMQFHYSRILHTVRSLCSRNQKLQEMRTQTTAASANSSNVKLSHPYTSSRKISLTCQSLRSPLPNIVVKNELGTGSASDTSKKRSSSRLRSPLPSPPTISPSSSPVPSPSRNRFQVFKVIEKSSSTSSLLSPTPSPSSPLSLSSNNHHSEKANIVEAATPTSTPPPPPPPPPTSVNKTPGSRFSRFRVTVVKDSSIIKSDHKATEVIPKQKQEHKKELPSGAKENISLISIKQNQHEVLGGGMCNVEVQTDANKLAEEEKEENNFGVATISSDTQLKNQNEQNQLVQENINSEKLQSDNLSIFYDTQNEQNKVQQKTISKKEEEYLSVDQTPLRQNNDEQSQENNEANIQLSPLKETSNIPVEAKQQQLLQPPVTTATTTTEAGEANRTRRVSWTWTSGNYPATVDKLLSIFQNPGNLFSRSSSPENDPKKSDNNEFSSSQSLMPLRKQSPPSLFQWHKNPTTEIKRISSDNMISSNFQSYMKGISDFGKQVFKQNVPLNDVETNNQQQHHDCKSMPSDIKMEIKENISPENTVTKNTIVSLQPVNNSSTQEIASTVATTSADISSSLSSSAISIELKEILSEATENKKSTGTLIVPPSITLSSSSSSSSSSSPSSPSTSTTSSSFESNKQRPVLQEQQRDQYQQQTQQQQQQQQIGIVRINDFENEKQ